MPLLPSAKALGYFQTHPNHFANHSPTGETVKREGVNDAVLVVRQH
jgi:hypothetical protein